MGIGDIFGFNRKSGGDSQPQDTERPQEKKSKEPETIQQLREILRELVRLDPHEQERNGFYVNGHQDTIIKSAEFIRRQLLVKKPEYLVVCSRVWSVLEPLSEQYSLSENDTKIMVYINENFPRGLDTMFKSLETVINNITNEIDWNSLISKDYGQRVNGASDEDRKYAKKNLENFIIQVQTLLTILELMLRYNQKFEKIIT